MQDSKLKRREFLQLAKVYNPEKHNVAGFYVSEKLDGTRCFWDGGLTRGMPTEQVPWASVMDPKKPGERKKKIKPISTGLWSRYGNPIMAPDSFLNGLPAMFLDGELWAGRGNFQTCRSICAGDEPDDRFDQIQFAVYSSPSPEHIFGDGEIKNSNFHLPIFANQLMPWVNARIESMFGNDFARVAMGATFEDELVLIRDALDTQTDFAYLHQQTRLAETAEDAAAGVERALEGVLDLGGEGLVIRNPVGLWTPKRVSELLKYKPHDDAEATITGFTSGRLTNKGSKHRGKIGALITNYDGKRLELAGLNDEERLFADEHEREYAWDNCGVDMPSQFQGKHFKVGDVVQFKYRELSDDGIPKEARYFRGA